MRDYSFRRGDIFLARLNAESGSRVIRGCRPVVIVSNDCANRFAPVVNVIPVTSKKKKDLPAHVELSGFGLEKSSIAIVEQIRTLDKSVLLHKIGSLNGTEKMEELERAIRKQLNVA